MPTRRLASSASANGSDASASASSDSRGLSGTVSVSKSVFVPTWVDVVDWRWRLDKDLLRSE